MKTRFITLLFALILPLVALADDKPTSANQVFAEVTSWRVTDRQMDRFASASDPKAKPTQETAVAFFARTTSVNSTEERKFAVRLIKANASQIEDTITRAEAASPSPNWAALRQAVKRIAQSASANESEIREIRRVLDTVR